jgi:hypothetical protein
VTYARLSSRCRWYVTLPSSWLVFLTTTSILYVVPQRPLVGFVLVVIACAIGTRLLPSLRGVPASLPHPAWDLPLRMIAAMTLVLVLTRVAAWLGPSLSGLLTPFPLATAILAAFTHAQRGSEAVVAFFHGFIPALVTFAVFCFMLAVTLPVMPLGAALATAFAAQLVLQVVLYRQHAEALSLAE